MVDAFYRGTDEEAHTGLTVKANNLFCKNGYLQETGLIEHIAQSAAAFAGYETYKKGKAPQHGYIGEVKKLSIKHLPAIGEKLHTQIVVKAEAQGVTLIAAKTQTEQGTEAASCQMKIFIKPA